MSWADDPRIHNVSCSLVSDAEGVGFNQAEALSERLEKYARRLGFAVMYENVDRIEPGECR